ncbi:MAG TPA: DNA methyltransferase [Acidobacteriota bacterium]|nr:DNA methyltransferase [Acidobacteriota bacterium]
MLIKPIVDTQMMQEPQYICTIAQDMPTLAVVELSKVLSVPLESIRRKKELVFIYAQADTINIQRLACTHDVFQIVATFTKSQTPTLKQTYNDESYKVIFLDSSKKYNKTTTQSIYRACFQSMKTPRVEMKKPAAIFAIVSDKSHICIAKRIFHNKEDFLKRNAHQRPKLHPSAMKPRFARAMINLAGVKQGTIYDPFCGTGGFIIEGIHLGLHMIGSDISEKMLQSAKINIAHENSTNTNFELHQESATTTHITADAIVADLPYGKNTKNITQTLYKEFLTHANKSKLSTTFILCFPRIVDKLLKESGYTIEHRFRYYVHGSLTRYIYVLTAA